MKWFKHQSTARNDEKIAQLEDKCGLEGYGFYFKMLELVAEIIDHSDKCEVTYSMSRWGRQTNVSTKKWLFLASCCSDVGLMIVRRCNDDISVNIPNLLKYRDNHTRNLQVPSKQDKEEYKEEIDNIKKKKNKEEIIVADAPIEPGKKPIEKNENEIFYFWKVTMNHHQAIFDSKRKKIIKTALSLGFSVDQLKQAIIGCSKTPHNIGTNETGTVYDGVHIIFKDAGQIERFMSNAISPPIPQVKQSYAVATQSGTIDSMISFANDNGFNDYLEIGHG